MPEPKTHDYTWRDWGHDFTIHGSIVGGQRLRASGWGATLNAGDYLILPNGDATTRYRIEHIRWAFDPPDMWHADLAFAPR
jgi:hypothetical protein